VLAYKYQYRCYGILIVFLCFSTVVKSQEVPNQKSLMGRVIGVFKKSNYVIAPIVAYKPITSWQVGLGVKYLYRPKAYDTVKTRKSFIAASAIYTLNNQILVNPYFVHFFNEENYMLDGYYGFKKFPQNFYGLGNQSESSSAEVVSLNEIKVEQMGFRKVGDDWFAGIGFRTIGVFNVRQQGDGILENTKLTGWAGFWSAGPTANVRLDSRDNILNARKGAYADVRLEFMQRFDQKNNNYTLLKIDTRKYLTPFYNKRNVLAGQLFMQSSVKGNVPFTELAFVGSDFLMRGYYDRRYIDRHFLGGQLEYRHTLPYNFGFVVFGGLGDVTSRLDRFQMNEIKYSVGAGIRYLIIPKEDINIRFDFGIGKNSNTFYLSIAEAF